MIYSWYKGGRMIVKSRDTERKRLFNVCVTQEYFDDYIGNQKSFVGNLSLRQSKVTTLGKLEYVYGSLRLGNIKISSLGNLKSVSNYLNLNGSGVTTLGNLEYVGFFLDLSNVNLTSLGKLEYVRESIYCTEGTTTCDLLMNSKFRNQVRYIF